MILAAADNPGGLNSILPVVKRLKNEGEVVTFVAGGASIDILNKEGIDFISEVDFTNKMLEEIFKRRPKVFLAGTSLGNTIDKKLLVQCKSDGIPSVYVLDYWANYLDRFSNEKNDLKFLPDYICVMDERSKKEMIQDGFDENKLVITGNPYFDEFTKGITGDGNRQIILFISQPMDGYDYGYREENVLSDVLEIIQNKINDGISLSLKVRLHPRESKGKFDSIISNYDFAGYDFDYLEHSLSESGLIIGMNSMVLFQASLAGKIVISYQPNLKVKDMLLSNDSGLSILIKNKDDLEKVFSQYLEDKLESRIKSSNITIKNATDKVINFINKVAI